MRIMGRILIGITAISPLTVGDDWTVAGLWLYRVNLTYPQ